MAAKVGAVNYFLRPLFINLQTFDDPLCSLNSANSRLKPVLVLVTAETGRWGAERGTYPCLSVCQIDKHM
jgi:hypothetical protein